MCVLDCYRHAGCIWRVSRYQLKLRMTDEAHVELVVLKTAGGQS